MIKITVKNKTVWQTKMLLPFIRRIAREEFPGTTPKNTRRRLTVHIVYNRGGKYYSYASGCAYLDSSWSQIQVPFPHPGRTFPVLDFCHVLGHEFAHNRGVKHADMGLHYVHGKYSNEHYKWASALPVPQVKAKPRAPSTAERRAKELKTAQVAVLTWQRKAKLAATKVKLWTRRVKTLEKRIALDRSATAAVSSASPGTFDAAPPSQFAGALNA